MDIFIVGAASLPRFPNGIAAGCRSYEQPVA
jgi:hypothetical protein